jgi:short-subunit dehydrogenase
MPFADLAGRVALVTGAARGIGRAIAAALLEKGARVALVDVDVANAEATAGALDPRRTRTAVYALDVTDGGAFERLIGRVEHDLGPLDILVNNAGVMALGNLLELAPEVDRRQVEINLFGVLNGMRAALPKMKRRHRGHIVNVASTAGVVGVPGSAVYCATKHAVVGLTEAVRREEEDSGVGFSYVCPIPVNTELMSGAGRVRWPRMQEPDDVARAVVHAIESGEVDVFVPRTARVSVVLQAITPRRFYERVGRMLKVDRMFSSVDEKARSSYFARAFG